MNKILTLSACALLFCMGTTFAGPILIQNPSFEDATLTINFPESQGQNIFVGNGTLAGWTAVGPSNGTAYGGAQRFNGLFGGTIDFSTTWWDGLNVANLFPTGSSNYYLEQMLSVNLESNTIYDLSVLVGRRPTFGQAYGYDVQLVAGSNVLASGNQIFLAPDSAGLHTLNFNSGANNAFAGLPLGIRLVMPDPTSEAFFDNVTLNSTSVPEPSTWAMLAGGLLGLGVVRNRRRRV